MGDWQAHPRGKQPLFPKFEHEGCQPWGGSMKAPKFIGDKMEKVNDILPEFEAKGYL